MHNEFLKQQTDLALNLEILNKLRAAVADGVGAVTSPEDATAAQKQMEVVRLIYLLYF